MLVKFHNRPAHRSFNNFVDDFFLNAPSIFRDDLPTNRMMPVNVRESEAGFEIDVIAPGFQKEDFKINLDKQILTISAEMKQDTENKDDQQKTIRNEYRFQSFKRSFTLNNKIDDNGIVAKYLNGVLTVNLPKKADVRVDVKQIEIQ